MSGKGLPIIEERVLSKKEQFEENTRARCEQAWEEDAAKLDPNQTVIGRERIKRTRELLAKLHFGLSLEGKAIADLGCGNAALASLFEGADITAVDVAQSALDKCPEHIKRVRGCLPYCRLPEESFDGVLLTDVIAELEPHLYRLMLSEVSVLMKRDGFFLCSTELDLYSEDPLGHFLAFLKTEFEVVETKKSYHRLYFYLRRWLDAPARFAHAGKEPTYRLLQLEKRSGFYRLWFYLNSLKWISYVWRPLTPLKNSLHQPSLLLFFERISEILWGEGALTHVIALCKRKSLHQLNK